MRNCPQLGWVMALLIQADSIFSIFHTLRDTLAQVRACMCQRYTAHTCLHTHTCVLPPPAEGLTCLLTLLPDSRQQGLMHKVTPGVTKASCLSFLCLRAWCLLVFWKSWVATLETLTLGNSPIVLLQLNVQSEGRALDHFQHLRTQNHNPAGLC
jgi:hypothetical protein